MSNVLKMAAVGGAVSAETDPNFNQTVLLLHGDGTNGAQNNTFLDGSTNNFTITRNGNTTQGTFSPFSAEAGKWSNFFNGSTDFLTTPSNAAFQMGTGDFSISLWYYPTTSATTNRAIFGIGGATSGSFQLFLKLGGVDNVLTLNTFAGSQAVTTGVVTVNAWNHIAMSRSSGTMSVYLNGTRVLNSTYSDNLSQQQLVIGRAYPALNQEYVAGYIADFRIVKGSAIYSGTTISVPTAPSTAISGTSVLTCQSNRFVDNSSNNFTITRNGDVRVTPFSPFAPSAAYDPVVNGGSGYFDGNGDYLKAPDDAAFSLGSNNFTIECWVYPTVNISSEQSLISQWGTSSGNSSWQLQIQSNQAKVGVESGSTVTEMISGTVVLGMWNHIAGTRTGNTFSLFLNGIRVATSTFSASVNDAAFSVGIGIRGANTVAPFLGGYIADARVVNGTAVYDATATTYTIPTAPLTAITNTSLLCNFTNAGIYDQTGKFVFETHNQVQISTAEKKFGTGSIAFDGTTDYISAFGTANQPPKQDMDMGTGDFTVECWLRTATPATTQSFFDTRPLSTNGAYITLSVSSSRIRFTADSSTRITTTTNLVADTWYHVALVRSSGSTKLYVNGVNEGSTYTDNNNYTAGLFRIGLNSFGSESFNGYLDDIRVTKGVARYTANFTPPTKEFPDL
jgi:hypothetical protein